MSYYHEARRHERNLREASKKAKVRAEKKQEELRRKRGDPLQSLIIVGRSCKIHKGSYAKSPFEEASLMPWNGDQDNLIDRFDGRAMLDRIPVVRSRPSSSHDRIESLLNYERYRGILEAQRTNVSEVTLLDKVAFQVKNKLLQGYGMRPEKLSSSSGKAAKPEKINDAAVSVDLDHKLLSLMSSDEGTGSSDEEEDNFDELDDLEDETLADSIMDERGKEFGIGGQHSAFTYSRLLQLERRQRVAERNKKEASEGTKTDVGNATPRGSDSRDSSPARQRNPPRRGSPTYEAYDNGRSFPGGSSGRQTEKAGGEKQYITSFDVVVPTPGDSADANDGPASSSDEEGGLSHMDLIGSFFPELAPEVRKKRDEDASSLPRALDRQTKEETSAHQESMIQSIVLARAKQQQKKLTPAEKLKLKMRMALNAKIDKDKTEEKRKAKVKEQEKRKRMMEMGVSTPASAKSDGGHGRRRSRSKGSAENPVQNNAAKGTHTSEPAERKAETNSVSSSLSPRRSRSFSSRSRSWSSRSPSGSRSRSRSYSRSRRSRRSRSRTRSYSSSRTRRRSPRSRSRTRSRSRSRSRGRRRRGTPRYTSHSRSRSRSYSRSHSRHRRANSRGSRSSSQERNARTNDRKRRSRSSRSRSPRTYSRRRSRSNSFDRRKRYSRSPRRERRHDYS